ncbi:MAG TPA: hypothetical protein VNI35_05440 [Nitrospira sp.]|nr:hypothetical protein [Nitrospira sp.]
MFERLHELIWRRWSGHGFDYAFFDSNTYATIELDESDDLVTADFWTDIPVLSDFTWWAFIHRRKEKSADTDQCTRVELGWRYQVSGWTDNEVLEAVGRPGEWPDPVTKRDIHTVLADICAGRDKESVYLWNEANDIARTCKPVRFRTVINLVCSPETLELIKSDLHIPAELRARAREVPQKQLSFRRIVKNILERG